MSAKRGFNHHDDSSHDNSVAEQSYRGGYDQGGNKILRMLKARATIAQIEERRREIHQWWTQPIQALYSSPGVTVMQDLPERWLQACSNASVSGGENPHTNGGTSFH